MNRADRVRAVRTKRILQIRNYGFSKLIDSYEKDIISATYSYQEIENIIHATYGTYKTESLEDIYLILNKRLRKFVDKMYLRLKQAFEFGNNKLMDSKGQKLTLKKPSYAGAIQSLMNDNLRYVKNIGDEQKKIILDEISSGIKSGKTYQETATAIHEKVKSITVGRAKTIAATEMNRAISQSMENTLKYNGFDYYIYITAGDNRVSDICNINSFGNARGFGNRLKHKTGAGPIPVRDSHINCRCCITAAPSN